VSRDVGMLKMCLTCFCLVHSSVLCGLWCGLGLVLKGVDSHAIPDQFVQFIQYAGGLKSRRSLFHLIWLQCV